MWWLRWTHGPQLSMQYYQCRTHIWGDLRQHLCLHQSSRHRLWYRRQPRQNDNTMVYIHVKLPWVFSEAPLIFNGVHGNTKGNLTGTDVAQRDVTQVSAQGIHPFYTKTIESISFIWLLNFNVETEQILKHIEVILRIGSICLGDMAVR